MRIRGRRSIVVASMLLVAGGWAAPVAGSAADYPSRAIRLVVPFPPGGGSDTVARLIAEKLSQRFGLPVVVDNKGGGGGVIGSRAVAHAEPDGYTLLLATTTTHAINASLIKDQGYDPVKDFAPVALVANLPLILVVNNSVPANSMQELVALARREPGKLNFASSGNGSSLHLAGEMLKRAANIDIVHVPYKGSAPAMSDLVGGQVDFIINVVPGTVAYVKTGKLKALAVASPHRTILMPGVPSMAEAGLPEVDASSWNGILAPAGTPRPIIDRLNGELAAIMKLPDVVAKLQALGVQATSSTPDAFGTFIRQETRRYAAILRDIGAKPD